MKELEYPVFMKDVNSELVVCFSSINTGHVIVAVTGWTVGEYSDKWSIASNTSVWKQYTPPLFEDGAIVWCWNDGSNIPTVRRYDAINNATCDTDGYRHSYANYDNYKLFEGELPFELPPIRD